MPVTPAREPIVAASVGPEKIVNYGLAALSFLVLVTRIERPGQSVAPRSCVTGQDKPSGLRPTHSPAK